MSAAESGKRRLQRGFTLLEMMVAMTILAVGMGAIIKASAGSARNASILRDKEVARWVALNKLTEMQVLQEWSTKGKKGEVNMLNATWYWSTRIQNVQDPDLRRIDVEVRRDPSTESYVYSITGFIGNPEIVSTF